MKELSDIVLAGRPLTAYVKMFGVIVVGIIAAQAIRYALAKARDAATEDGPGTVSKAVVDRTLRGLLLPAIYIGSVYAGISFLDLGIKTERIVDTVALVLLTWLVVRYAAQVLHVSLVHWFGKKGREATRQRIRPLFAIADVVLWITAVIFLLDNLGFKISTIVAGLGIGGITVALASQAVLGDLFGYFVILFDRPFDSGDFIVTGDISGTIEAIGIKTTKLRSLGGELIVIANSQLTSSKIHNYQHMERRRVVFSVSVPFDTDRRRLSAVPDIVRKAVEAREHTAFDRAHLRGFGQYSLDFEIVYFVTDADYNLYMDVQQAINFDIIEGFAREGIVFALPSRSVTLSAADTGGPEATTTK